MSTPSIAQGSLQKFSSINGYSLRLIAGYGTALYRPIFGIWKWNFEVKPGMKKEKPTLPAPASENEVVHA